MLPIDQRAFASTNPANRELVGAVAATDFAGLTLRHRAQHLRSIRQSIVDRGEGLATIAAETGKPIPNGWLALFTARALLTYTAHAARRGHSAPGAGGGQGCLLERGQTCIAVERAGRGARLRSVRR